MLGRSASPPVTPPLVFHKDTLQRFKGHGQKQKQVPPPKRKASPPPEVKKEPAPQANLDHLEDKESVS